MKRIFYSSIIIFTLFFSVSTNVFAQSGSYNFAEDSGLQKTAEKTGYLNTTFNSADSLESNIGSFITILMSFLGVLFLILIIFGGIRWMTAAGNQERIGKAKNILINSSIGLVIVLAAYALSYFILNFLVGIS